MDRDEAHRAFGPEGAEPFLNTRGGKAVTAPRLGHLGYDEIAFLCVCASVRRNQELLAKLFLVDRDNTPAPPWARAIYAEHAMPCAIVQLGDESAVRTIGRALVGR